LAAAKIAPDWSAQTFHWTMFIAAFVLIAVVIAFGRDPADGWARPVVYLFCCTLPILQGLRGRKEGLQSAV